MVDTPVCKCTKGFASRYDSLCRYCREKDFSRAQAKKVGVRHRGDGMTIDQMIRITGDLKMSNDYDDYVADQNGNVTNRGGQHQVEGQATSSVHELPITNDRVKLEHHSRLANSLVLIFNEVKVITKPGHWEGALLLAVTAGNGEEVEMWLPKKLCSNLDLEAQTVCVWDVFMNKKLAELDTVGGLAIPAEQYKQEELGDG